MNKVITCLEPLHGHGEQCGDMIRGKDDNDIVAKVQKHLKDVHGRMEVSREAVLAMAKPDPRERSL